MLCFCLFVYLFVYFLVSRFQLNVDTLISYCLQNMHTYLGVQRVTISVRVVHVCRWDEFLHMYSCTYTHADTQTYTHTHRMSHRSAQSTVSVCRSPGADRITHPWNRLWRHNVHIHQRTISHVSSQVDTCTLLVLWQRLSLCLSKHYTESTLTILNQSDNIFDDF